MSIPFWFNKPIILFNKENILQFWPTQHMSFEEKLNSISRTVILLSILGFIFTKNMNIIIIGIITLFIIISIYNFRKQSVVSSLTKEGFSSNKNNSSTTTNPITLETMLRSDFHPTTKKNPFGNVLLTDINDNPDRKSAAPSFNPDVYDDIHKMVKKQTQMLNSDIVNTNKQLYGDLYESYNLDKSLMRFYSTPNTRVTNDQGAYAEYLYGNMPSGKSSDPDGAFARIQDNYRHILN